MLTKGFVNKEKSLQIVPLFLVKVGKIKKYWKSLTSKRFPEDLRKILR